MGGSRGLTIIQCQPNTVGKDLIVITGFEDEEASDQETQVAFRSWKRKVVVFPLNIPKHSSLKTLMLKV